MLLKLVNQYHKLRQRGDHQKQELSEWKQAEHKIRGINHKQLQEKKDKHCEAQNQGGTLIEKKKSLIQQCFCHQSNTKLYNYATQ